MSDETKVATAMFNCRYQYTWRNPPWRFSVMAFDLLYLNGYDLRNLPLFERKALLKKLVDKSNVQFSESFDVDGAEMFKQACKTGLEGVVSKVRATVSVEALNQPNTAQAPFMITNAQR